MAIVRLRPNSDIALSSLNCSSSFIIVTIYHSLAHLSRAKLFTIEGECLALIERVNLTFPIAALDTEGVEGNAEIIEMMDINDVPCLTIEVQPAKAEVV